MWNPRNSPYDKIEDFVDIIVSTLKFASVEPELFSLKIHKHSTRCINRIRLSGSILSITEGELAKFIIESFPTSNFDNLLRFLRSAMQGLSSNGPFRKGGENSVSDYIVDVTDLKSFLRRSDCGAVIGGVQYWSRNLKYSIGELTLFDSGSGEEYTGTAFCYAGDEIPEEFNRFLTCRHNILDDSGRFYDSISLCVNGASHNILAIAIFKSIDLAILTVAKSRDIVALGTRGYTLLERVYTAGFPRVSLMVKSPLIIHEGTINGEIDRFGGSSDILTSCEVAPGSSGGPLLNLLSNWIGVVVERAEIEDKLGKGSYNFCISVYDFDKSVNAEDYSAYIYDAEIDKYRLVE